MDDRLIAQVNATATSLREAAKAADKELTDAQRERAAIDARIKQLRSLRDQLRTAIREAEGTASGGTTRKKATRKKATRRKATRRKKATRKKATAKQAARTVASRGNGAG